MRLKLYRAASVAEAMARVRADLGPEALILTTRRVDGGIELAAALEPEPDVAPPAMGPPPAIETAPAIEPPLAVGCDPERLRLLAFHGVPSALHAPLGQTPLDAALGATLRFAPLAVARGDRPILLIGPPGAGKTLTAVRLATRLVMGGTRPAVITADGKRAGAIEQLAAFTRLLGIELIVAADPVLLSRALARAGEGVPVLIDAPGTDPFEAGQREEIGAFAATAGAAVALVLPAGMDPAESADLASAYAEAGAKLMVATRLDLARRLGGVLAAAHAGGLSLVEAGVGPGAADGLAPLTAAFLASRLIETANATKPGPSA